MVRAIHSRRHGLCRKRAEYSSLYPFFATTAWAGSGGHQPQEVLLRRMVGKRIWGMALIGGLLLLSALPAFSQTYDVVGLVQDEEKGEPIGQVEISLQSGKILGYTKSSGRFEI